MRNDATPERVRLTAPPVNEPVEFSVEDAILNTWVEDTGFYLRLEPAERDTADTTPGDAS